MQLPQVGYHPGQLDHFILGFAEKVPEARLRIQFSNKAKNDSLERNHRYYEKGFYFLG
jgi:hypothetical protein